MPYTREELLSAIRQDHPEFKDVDDNKLFAAVATDHPDLVKAVTIPEQKQTIEEKPLSEQPGFVPGVARNLKGVYDFITGLGTSGISSDPKKVSENVEKFKQFLGSPTDVVAANIPGDFGTAALSTIRRAKSGDVGGAAADIVTPFLLARTVPPALDATGRAIEAYTPTAPTVKLGAKVTAGAAATGAGYYFGGWPGAIGESLFGEYVGLGPRGTIKNIGNFLRSYSEDIRLRRGGQNADFASNPKGGVVPSWQDMYESPIIDVNSEPRKALSPGPIIAGSGADTSGVTGTTVNWEDLSPRERLLLREAPERLVAVPHEGPTTIYQMGTGEIPPKQIGTLRDVQKALPEFAQKVRLLQEPTGPATVASETAPGAGGGPTVEEADVRLPSHYAGQTPTTEAGTAAIIGEQYEAPTGEQTVTPVLKKKVVNDPKTGKFVSVPPEVTSTKSVAEPLTQGTKVQVNPKAEIDAFEAPTTKAEAKARIDELTKAMHDDGGAHIRNTRDTSWLRRNQDRNREINDLKRKYGL